MNEIIGNGWAFPLSIGSQGGFALTGEHSEIDQAIIIILTTAIGERVMRPTFGSRLYELIYEPCSAHTLALAEQYVRDALAMWEPRIEVTGVLATYEDNERGAILIDIDYNVHAAHQPRTLVYPFYTIPDREE